MLFSSGFGGIFFLPNLELPGKRKVFFESEFGDRSSIAFFSGGAFGLSVFDLFTTGGVFEDTCMVPALVILVWVAPRVIQESSQIRRL